ncbi:MAG: hypothetical protein RR011_00835 [Oscillospiraceae bacterium]
MEMKLSKPAALKLFKKMGGAAALGLQMYRTTLVMKLFTIDAILKTVKSQHNLLSGGSPTAPVVKTKEKTEMKKSNGLAIFAFFAAVCSALGAVAYYLYKREKELDEYEDTLFNDEYLDDYMPHEENGCDETENSCDEKCSCGCEETPVEDAAPNAEDKI